MAHIAYQKDGHYGAPLSLFKKFENNNEVNNSGETLADEAHQPSATIDSDEELTSFLEDLESQPLFHSSLEV